jgi:hypothetical protein
MGLRETNFQHRRKRIAAYDGYTPRIEGGNVTRRKEKRKTRGLPHWQQVRRIVRGHR